MMSVLSLFIMGMHDALSTGCFRDAAAKDAFSADGIGYENWIESVIKAYDNATTITIIFNNTKTEQNKCISSFFSDHLYPASAPCLNITSVNRLTSTIANFNAVSTNLGVSAGPLGGITLPLPMTTTVAIQKERKADTEAPAKILTRQKALFLTATIDFDN